MLRLLTFGGLVIEGEGGVPAARLRRPWLAMLAVIAATGERGVPRERLIALFWPDSDEEKARHSARQVLYGLRQELGREVVRSVGTVLSLDPSTITSDVSDFRAALAAGDRALAVAMARGPFLDAFYLPGATAFERWVEEERGRLTAATKSALVTLATEATRANDRDAAVDWWRQLTVMDPLSGRYAVGHLKALAARGDRAEALAFARQHEIVLRRELETDPDPDVRRIEAELRAMPSTSAIGDQRPAIVEQPAISAQRPVIGDKRSVTGDQPPTTSERPPNADSPDRPVRRRSIALVAAAAMLLLIVTAAFARQLGWLRSDRTPTFAVGFIHEDGVPDSFRTGRVLTDMVATNLARVEGLRVLANSRLLELLRPGADPAAGYSNAARQAGATELLEGQVRSLPDRQLTMEIRRVELATGIVKGVYRVVAPTRYELVDSITQLVSRDLRLSSPLGPVADATTNSLVAYRFYEEGLRAYYQGDPDAARRLMNAALKEDSTFAVAAWYEAKLSGARQVTPDGRHVTDASRRAIRLAQRAPDRERLTILADMLVENQEPTAHAVAESLVTRFPDDPRALMTLSRARGARGDWRGAVVAIERAIALDSIAEIDQTRICRYCDDLGQLTDLYLWWDSLPASRRTARRLLAARPGSTQPHAALALVASRLGDSSEAYASYRRLVAAGAPDRYLKLALDASLEYFDAVERDVRPLLASSSVSDWSNGTWLMLISLRNQGRMREATEFNLTGKLPGLPTLNVDFRAPEPYHRALLELETGNPREAARRFALLPIPDTTRWPLGVVARNRSWRGTLTGMALAAAGDTAAVRMLVDSVEHWGRLSGYGRDPRAHHYLRGMLHGAAGQHEDAVREFRAAIHSPTLGFTRVNYELARSLLAAGRPKEAVEALQPALRGAVDASNLYITRTDIHELLAEAFDRSGQRDSASAHYRAVEKAWERADPQFHGRRSKATAWLTRNSRGP